ALLAKAKSLFLLADEMHGALCFQQVALIDPVLAHTAWAKMLIGMGRLGEAITHARLACAFKPNEPLLLASLAKIQHDAGQIDEARLTIATAIDLAPRNPVVRLTEGTILLANGPLEEAAKSFQRVLDETPECAEALGKLAAIRLAQSNPSEAESLLSKAILISPHDPSLLIHQAQALFGIGRKSEALKCLVQTIKTPLTYDLLLNRAQGFLLLGDLDRCLADCDQLMQDYPCNSANHILRGAALIGSGRPDEARADLAKALAHNPGYTVNYVSLAKLHLELGEIQKASLILRKMRAIAPTDPSVIELQAMISASKNALAEKNHSTPAPKKRKLDSQMGGLKRAP
ncbi:MAG: hypothetical protein RIR70_2034, partial [Pseudomonadota bacterium]